MTSAEDLLQILNTHGQQFVESFKINAPSKKRKRAGSRLMTNSGGDQTGYDSEEWKGCEVGDTEGTSDIDSEGNGTFPAVPCACSRLLIFFGFESLHMGRTNTRRL